MAKVRAHFIETILTQSVNTPEIPLAFVGSPGNGKTAIVEQYAEKNNLPLVKLLASTLDESDCFIGDTEILTEDGFVRLDTLQENVKVAQVDEYNNVSFVVPSQIVQKPHDGEMVVFKSKRLDVAMTPSHRVAFRPCPVVKDTRHQMPLQIASASEFLTKKGRAYISSGGIASYGNNLSEKQKFHIAFAADGCVLYKHKTTNTFAARFGFSKKRKQVEFERLCCVLGLSFTKGKPRKFDNPKWKDSINYDVIVPNDFVTKDISDIASLDTVSSNFAREALEYISKWDGTRMTSSTMRFSSKKKIDVDYVQALAALCNTRSKIGYDVHVFYVDVTFGKTDVVIEKHHVKSRYYKGDVFCVTVPTGMFIARSNNATFVTGNCAGIVVSTAEKRISQDEHGNLKIVPATDGGAKTLSPDWVNRLRDGGMLLLDELNTARREVQDTLLTLIQSRALPNGDKLHPNVRIVACMNDFVQCNNYCMSPAMRNRFAWFRVSPNVKQWLGWLKTAVHPDVHAFMTAAFERGMLFSADDAFMDDSENLFTTPRSLYNLIAFCGGCSKTVTDTLKLVQTIVKYAPNFVDKAAVGVLKSLGSEAKKDRSNAVFQAYLDNNTIDGSVVADITEAVRVDGLDDEDEDDEHF